MIVGASLLDAAGIELTSSWLAVGRTGSDEYAKRSAVSVGGPTIDVVSLERPAIVMRWAVLSVKRPKRVFSLPVPAQATSARSLPVPGTTAYLPNAFQLLGNVARVTITPLVSLR